MTTRRATTRGFLCTREALTGYVLFIFILPFLYVFYLSFSLLFYTNGQNTVDTGIRVSSQQTNEWTTADSVLTDINYAAASFWEHMDTL